MRKLAIGVVVALSTTLWVALVPVHVAQAAPATQVAVLAAGDGDHAAAPPARRSGAPRSGTGPGTSAAAGATPAPASPVAHPTPFALSHLAVRWHGDEDATVEVRWATAAGWAPWQAVVVSHDMTDVARAPACRGAAGTECAGDLVLSGLVRADDAVQVQARGTSGAVRGLTVIAIDTTHGQRRVVRSTERPSAAAAAAPAYPALITRAQWGADESLRKGTPEFAPITKLVVHHTATSNVDADPASTVRAIYAYHTQTQGWNDIGYNFLIDQAGRVYEGRYARAYGPGEVHDGESSSGLGVIGAHAIGANTGSVGVALLGTFDTQGPTPAAVSALEDLLAAKAGRHGIDPAGASPYVGADGTTRTFANISGHRDTSATDCPGDILYNMLPTIRQAVSGRVGGAAGPTLGYWTATADGQVFPFGQARSFGSMAGTHMNAPVVGMAPTPSGGGYWLLGADGGIFSFGDARFFGSTGGMRLNQPVVGLQPTPSGQGYWLVARDGGIFTFGDAVFFGSTGGLRLNRPVVGMAATPSGRGYWLVATDGGIFTFGDAVFHGSTGSLKLNSPVLAMAGSHVPGGGYWLVAGDGGIFTFDVPFLGSVPGLHLAAYAGSAGMASTTTDRGYYVLAADGGIFTFGDAGFLGARSGLSGASRAAAMGVM